MMGSSLTIRDWRWLDPEHIIRSHAQGPQPARQWLVSAKSDIHACILLTRGDLSMSSPSKAVESILIENRVFEPSEAFVKAARISGMDAYNALCAEAAQD